MIPESVDNEQLFVTYSGTESGYVDTGLIVEITNGETEEVWEDYIPLRFFSSVLPVTFNGESIKNTENGALNGFIIYPDGNSKFFAVRSGGKKTVYIPLFNYTDEYTIAFSGATITKNLDNNAEVFYGINIGSTSEVPLETSGQNVTSYQQAGGNNHSIKNAYDISKDEASFEAYLSSGEADYYKFTAGDFTSKKITNIKDINFEERECIVYGKGEKERRVYFDAKAKLHLQNYISTRKDNNPALFVTLDAPHERLKISGVEIRLRTLGRKLNLTRIHPHKFRRTMATRAIDKGMPIEQVQKLLGHSQIDTTMHYAIVNQTNVKVSHRKYIA